MENVIRVSKKKVRQLLMLYTMDGFTMEEAGITVFRAEMVKGVPVRTITQRIMHYFGLGMEHRRNYAQEGLTEDIIKRILDNRMLAFPLLVPLNGSMGTVMSFDTEVNRYLGGNKNKWRTLSYIKNILVLALLGVLTLCYNKWARSSLAVWLIPALIGIFIVIMGVVAEKQGVEENPIPYILVGIFAAVLVGIYAAFGRMGI